MAAAPTSQPLAKYSLIFMCAMFAVRVKNRIEHEEEACQASSTLARTGSSWKDGKSIQRFNSRN